MGRHRAKRKQADWNEGCPDRMLPNQNPIALGACRSVTMKTIWMAVVFVVALGVLSVSAAAQSGGAWDTVCLELDGYRTTTWQAVAPQRGRSLEVVPAGPIQMSDWA